MSIELKITELTEAVRALTVVMQSAGAAGGTTAAPAPDASTGKGKGKGKGPETAASTTTAETPKNEPKPDPEAESFDTMKATVQKLVNDHSKGQGKGKEAATAIFVEYGVKNIQGLFDKKKYAEIMGKLNAALAPAASEESSMDFDV